MVLFIWCEEAEIHSSLSLKMLGKCLTVFCCSRVSLAEATWFSRRCQTGFECG